MKEYYNLIDAMKGYLEGNNNVSTVTQGDMRQIDLNKSTIFPLSNIDVVNATFSQHVITFEIQVFCIDTVDVTKENAHDQLQPFYGADNIQDVYNTQLTVLNGLQSSLRRGGLNDCDYVLPEIEDVTANQIRHWNDNLLAGWEMTFSIDVPNDQIRDINKDGSTCG